MESILHGEEVPIGNQFRFVEKLNISGRPIGMIPSFQSFKTNPN